MNRNTIKDIRKLYRNEEKIVCLTAYDSTMAAIADQSGCDMLLVGDSLGMTMLGYDSTVPVTIADCLHHTKAVVRGSKKAFVIADLPFGTYHGCPNEALKNAIQFIQEGFASAVKVEGEADMAPVIAKMVRAGIPVVGHIGLLPQSVLKEGGYYVKGRTEESEASLLKDALAFQEAGACMIVIEGVVAEVAERITDALNVPTIGIGAGAGCSGQVQVIHDILGLFDTFVPRHAKRYADLGTQMREAVQNYSNEVKNASFPTDENVF